MSFAAASPSSAMTKMKSYRGKLPLSLITLTLCCFAFIALLYAESDSLLKARSCARTSTVVKPKKIVENSELDDRFEFEPEECDITRGKWVFNRSIKPLYTDRSCPYVERQFSCEKNGQLEVDYRHWEWQPDDCYLPKFDAEVSLKKLRGKRLAFVGDSLQRSQWESFVCMVEWTIPPEKKSMKRGRIRNVFKAEEYNATIEFYWAPFLVESNTDLNFLEPKKRIIKIDSVSNSSRDWEGADILAFNTYVWWMISPRLKTLWGSFSNGEEGSTKLEAPVAYTIGLKTWANWIDSTRHVFSSQPYPLYIQRAKTGAEKMG